MSALGIDVSSYNPIDPNPPGAVFTLVKATEGHTYVSPAWAGQVRAARARNQVVGHYHFLHPGDVPGQISFFLGTVAPLLQAGDVLAIDWETCEDGTIASCAEKDQALQLLGRQQPTHRQVVYMNRDFLANHDSSGYHGSGLWIADVDHPAGQPAISAPWTFHQYGEIGGVDADVYNGGIAQLRAWAGPVNSAPAYPGRVLQLTSPLMHGADVLTVQQRLIARGWPLQGGADGWYGQHTADVVRAFQQDSTAHGWPLAADAEVGPATWAALWNRPVS